MNIIKINNVKYKKIHYLYENFLGVQSLPYDITLYENKYVNLNSYKEILYFNDLINYTNKLKSLSFIQKDEEKLSTCIFKLERLIDKIPETLLHHNFINCKDIVEYFTPIQIRYERVI